MTSIAFRFGTVGAPRSMPKKPGGSMGAVLYLAEMGLSAFELAWVQSVRVSEETCLAIRSTAKEQDVAISINAPYFINLNADSQEWPKSRQRLMAAAHFGNLAGATDIIFHPGSYFGESAEKVLQQAIPRLRECVQELRAAGNPVILRPETMGKSALLGSLEDVLALSREVEGVAPCLDFAHLHARAGDGSMNSHDEWMAVLQRYGKAVGRRSLKRLHIHLSGIAYGPKGERNHLMLGEADLNLDDLLGALRDAGCGGRIVCESPVMEEDAVNIRAAWERVVSG